jgi:taurine dioxygenase
VSTRAAVTRKLDAGPRTIRRLADDAESAPFERVGVSPLTPTIGAEIAGVDLGEPVDDDTLAELRRALLEWKVLFFRDQHITGEQHRAFARRWGELEVHPFLPSGEAAEVVLFEKNETVKGFENIWHSDVSWREIPSMGSVLRAREVPEVGGDTLFADMYCAYEGLDPALRERIDGLHAVHDFTHTFGRGLPPDELEKMQGQYPAVEHPVVRTHPETGRRLLYVNAPFTSHIVGLDDDESEELLGLLCAQATVPEYQCRFHWAPDSIAFWDNRAVQHYAASDYYPQRRVMERATIIGDRPY